MANDFNHSKTPNMLPQLPEELFQQIFSSLQPELPEPYWESSSHANRILYRTLASACLANRLCHRLVAPLLYRNVELYGAEYQRENDLLKVSGYSPNAQQLLRTLMRAPGLAADIRALKIENFETNKSDRGPFLPHDELKEIISTIRVSAPFRSVLLGTARMRVEDAEVALILALLPNLEYLQITAVYDFNQTLCGRMIRELMDHWTNVTPRKQPLSKLREVAIRNMCATRTDWGFLVDEVVPILRLPSLRTLRGYAMQVVGATDYPPEANSSKVERVHIDTGVLDDNGIEVLFTACPNLRHLEFTVGDMVEWTLDLDLIGEQLRKYGCQLETLALRTKSATYGSILEDLRPLDRLQHLAVTKAALLGHLTDRGEDYLAARPSSVQLEEVFPTSLKTLELLGWDVNRHDITFVLKSGVSENIFGGAMDDRNLISPLLNDTRFARLSSIACELRTDLKLDVEALGWKQSRSIDGSRLMLSRVASENSM